MARSRRFGPARPAGINKGLLSFEMDGPFFTADINKTIDANVRDLMERLARVGEGEVRARVRGGAEGNAARPFVRGRVHSIEDGHRWGQTFVVSAGVGGHGPVMGALQRRVNAQLSGRRTATAQRSFTDRGAARVGKPLGTTRGAGGRQAFSGAARAMRLHILTANVIEGLD